MHWTLIEPSPPFRSALFSFSPLSFQPPAHAMIRFLSAIVIAGLSSFLVAEETTSIVANGRVVDADDRPIAGVDVAIIGSVAYAYVPHRHPGLIDAKCDPDGNFRIAWPQSDRRFLQDDHVLLVAHDGAGSMVVQNVPLRKLVAGVPISLTLVESAPKSIRVLDADQKPIGMAKVSAAKFGSLVLPYRSDDATAVGTSDADGNVSFAGVRSSALSHVYVSSPSLGHQCLHLSVDDQGNRTVVARPTKPERGSLEFVGDRDAPTDWSGVSVTLITGESDDGDYVWSETDVQASGDFSTRPLADGNLRFVVDFPSSLPLAVQSEAAGNFKRADPGQPIKIPLERATKVSGKVVSAVDGSPLGNIFIRVSDPRPAVFSQPDGTFTFLHDQSRVNYFPHDVLGRHVMGGAFFVYPQELPQDHKLEIESVSMQPASAAIGKVVDDEGRPISGATVGCDYKVERFTYQSDFYTDAEGEFRLDGIIDGTGVTLSATKDRQMTTSPTSLVLASDSRPILKIQPRHGLRIIGQVVDGDGNPVSSAKITVRYPNVTIKEFMSGLDTNPTDAFPSDGPILSADDGHFASPVTLDWQRNFSVSINSLGKRTKATYWRDASDAGQNKTDLDLGSITLLDEPADRPRIVTVVDDQTGQPIESARVVFLSSIYGQSTGRTGSDGRTSILRHDGLQVLAVDADGYRPQILPVDLYADSLPTISLVRPGSPMQSHQGVVHRAEELRTATKELLTLVPSPFPDGTPHRQRLYGWTMAFADFDTTLATVKALAGEETENRYSLGDELLSMPWLSPQQIDSAMSLADDRNRFYLVITQASRSNDDDQKLELLGEAIVMARAKSGDDQLYAISAIADQLLGMGETELVKELVTEAWQSQSQLATVLENGQRTKMTGIARYFAPIYALVDFDTAMEFIRWTALTGEIEPLQGKTMIYVAAYDPAAWTNIAKQSEDKPILASALGWFRGPIEFATFDDGVRTLAQIEPGNDKIEALIHLLKSDLPMADGRQPTDADRLPLAREVLTILDSRDAGYTDSHVSTLAARAAKLVAQWDRELAQQLLFAAIWNCDKEPTILPMNVTSTLAIELATHDRAIADALVRPCFDDWSWLFQKHDRDIIFRNNGPINAAAAIDPKWAIELATDLCENHFKDEPSRKYETVRSIVNQWAELTKPTP